MQLSPGARSYSYSCYEILHCVSPVSIYLGFPLEQVLMFSFGPPWYALYNFYSFKASLFNKLLFHLLPLSTLCFLYIVCIIKVNILYFSTLLLRKRIHEEIRLVTWSETTNGIISLYWVCFVCGQTNCFKTMTQKIKIDTSREKC